jgi:hypothetical protein
MRISAGNGNCDGEKTRRQEYGVVPGDGVGAIADVYAGRSTVQGVRHTP